MSLYKTIAVFGLVLSIISSAAFAAEPSTPAASVALSATTATPVAPPATPSKIKETKKRFLLTHSSSVYEKPDKASPVIGHVRHGTHVNVTGRLTMLAELQSMRNLEVVIAELNRWLAQIPGPASKAGSPIPILQNSELGI
jgi:hypothetical protein